jgi:hypothetical protein
MQIPPQVQAVLERHERFRIGRSVYEQDWRDIRDLIRPTSYEINNYGPTYTPAKRSEKAIDSTATDSLEELSSALHSYLTSPVSKWFGLEITDQPVLMRDPDVLLWLEQVSDIIYSAYADVRALFNTSLHEAYMDLGAFGIAFVNQEWKDGHILFRTHPVSDCFIDENSSGVVDTIHRTMRWTVRQVEQEFKYLPPVMSKMKQSDRVNVIHSVGPRSDRDWRRMDSLNKPYASIWVCENTKELLYEGGYNTFPYHCPRWLKITGEVYGRSPAMKCLPDVKMLNSMDLTIIKSAEKIVDPPLQVSDDAFLTPIKTSPGSIMYKEPGADNIEPLLTGGNIPIGLEITNQKREAIKKAFYNDWVRLGKDKQEMTAYEVQDRRDEKLRLLAPMLGRQETELLGPMIARSMELLSIAGRIPPAPDVLRDREMKSVYSSPAAQAQTGVKAATMGRFIEGIIPLAQVDGGILDIINMDNYVQEMAIARGISRKILRSQKEVDAIRQARAQQQQMQQVAQVAEPASKAIKNLADAQNQGGGLSGY